MADRVEATVGELSTPEILQIEATTEAGYRLTLTAGDRDQTSAGPMETVLAALAGCTALDVAGILHKKRQRATSYRLRVVGERAAEHPRVFTRIVVEHLVGGEVEPEALRRAVELSATRYCSVNAMLVKGVEIEHRYRLNRDGSPELSASVVTQRPTTD
jgi:putative redox protein